MKVLFCLLVCLMFCASQSQAEEIERPNGLMWNKTGLPLVFPLQVKSLPGRDYYIVLSQSEDKVPALAAYVRGGEFFRVLVPPGTYNLEFATGTKWLGEDKLFGREETQFFALRDPLEFAILNDRTKGGHSIDLRSLGPDGLPEITVVGANLCQTLRSQQGLRVVSPVTQETERNPVGQDILTRRFERGENAFETHDRKRQQDNFDPPVLGTPQVPLVRPSEALTVESTNGVHANRIYEVPC